MCEEGIRRVGAVVQAGNENAAMEGSLPTTCWLWRFRRSNVEAGAVCMRQFGRTESSRFVQSLSGVSIANQLPSSQPRNRGGADERNESMSFLQGSREDQSAHCRVGCPHASGGANRGAN
jgi:hypothetical protein